MRSRVRQQGQLLSPGSWEGKQLVTVVEWGHESDKDYVRNLELVLSMNHLLCELGTELPIVRKVKDRFIV